MFEDYEDCENNWVGRVDNRKDWEKEWEAANAPDFKSEGDTCYKRVVVRFENEDDYQDFQKLIGQKLTSKTKSIWHPALIQGKHSALRYVFEGDVDES